MATEDRISSKGALRRKDREESLILEGKTESVGSLPSFAEFCPSALEIPISGRYVSELAHCGPSRQWDTAVEEAIGQLRSLAAPYCRWVEVSNLDLGGLFPGGSPVEPVVLKHRRWAFVATIGTRVESRVKEFLDQARFLESVLLDAAGSAAVDSLADLVEARCSGDSASTRFSPGYCGWSLEVQSKLFELLKPDEERVRLLPSFLMSPLKSISGIVVQSKGEPLEVDPEACGRCQSIGCNRRPRKSQV